MYFLINTKEVPLHFKKFQTLQDRCGDVTQSGKNFRYKGTGFLFNTKYITFSSYDVFINSLARSVVEVRLKLPIRATKWFSRVKNL